MNQNNAGTSPPVPDETGKTFMGHPRGLATLFFTEMWERFSYYGMRALLVLFMTAPLTVNNPGLGFDVGKATAIYGLYTSMVYLLALAGGWVADNLWGQRKAVFRGGVIIAAGHFTMAAPLIGFPDVASFYGGLILIVLGTGLLKPNVSTMVGDLYPEPSDDEKKELEATGKDAEDWGARRDAGFSIFYMGINIGAILGPTICSFLGEGYNFHWGFSIAGFGMLLGLFQYKRGAKYLGNAGELKIDDDAETLQQRSKLFYTVTAVAAAALILFVFLATSGIISITLQAFATGLGYAIIVLAILYFVYLFVAGGYDTDQKKRLGAIFWLFILAAIFWSGFEQAGSSMNLFARDLTNRMIGNFEMPAGWLQNINPAFIVIFAPIFGWLWTWLAHRNANPSIPAKFALGLLGLAAGFFVLSWGAVNATAANPVTPAWLIVTYFLHTCGELALSPVGLSSITKLAPKDRVGQMMGIWFIAAALGNLFAGLVAGSLESLAPSSLFWNVALIIGGAGLVALLVSPWMKKLMGNVK
ncbi:MAG: peptide MFS transporter [Candidatus Marinimicrobia bacterium]|nr:peptide MFS transporter [Candidatus Neomarinimicrobiota bacterium]MCF7830120.1 peptide MFS transporter [Candidatus Neomarinimicrobiota bacterium]MCF7882489.1 peptide MFS transporter [Candidatus Neomarinimicrobiota bacterium]